MEDWEDEDIPELTKKLTPLIKSEWDDEDADLDDVKDSWEDEEESVVEEHAIKAPKKATKESEKDKKGKALEVVMKEEKLDPLEEKLRQQRLVEEADFKSTAELFGKRGDGNYVENFIPKSQNDFLEYAELISHKLMPYEKSFHYMSLLKDVMRLAMDSLNGVDAKEVASSITAVANEKIKAEKEASKKKTGGKKKQLNSTKDDDNIIADGYDEPYDDYDFM